MTTSGLTTFNLDLNDMVEEAFERAGSELRTGYDLRTARRSLNLLFADWANRGVNMWTFEQNTITLVAGQPLCHESQPLSPETQSACADRAWYSYPQRLLFRRRRTFQLCSDHPCG